MDNRELLQEITQRVDSSAKETREYVDSAVKASGQETREYVDTTVRTSVEDGCPTNMPISPRVGLARSPQGKPSGWYHYTSRRRCTALCRSSARRSKRYVAVAPVRTAVPFA